MTYDDGWYPIDGKHMLPPLGMHVQVKRENNMIVKGFRSVTGWFLVDTTSARESLRLNDMISWHF